MSAFHTRCQTIFAGESRPPTQAATGPADEPLPIRTTALSTDDDDDDAENYDMPFNHLNTITTTPTPHADGQQDDGASISRLRLEPHDRRPRPATRD